MHRLHGTVVEINTWGRGLAALIEKQRADLERQIGRLVDAIAERSIGNVGAVGQKLRELEGKLADLQYGKP